MPYQLGVDLGTTYTAAAIATDGSVEIVQLGSSIASIPSVVLLRDDGTVLIGEAAQRRSIFESDRTAREFKRRLGDPTPYLLGGTPYGAEALTGYLLASVVERVTAERGEAPDAIVLAHPAVYGPYKLGFLEEAARLAGVGAVQFVPEPVAAAVYYAQTERVVEGETIAVYDFGGGTLDLAVVRKTADGFEVVGTPEGMERFGGVDLDQSVFGHVDASLGGILAHSDPDDPAAMAALATLRASCRDAKEALSGDTDVTIPVMLPSVHTEVRLTRGEFEDMIRPRVRETMGALERTVRSAGVSMDDLSSVLLVGGASRIPLVADMVRDATGRPVAVDTHPKHAVAMGAALYDDVPKGSAGPPPLVGASPVAGRESPVATSRSRNRSQGRSRSRIRFPSRTLCLCLLDPAVRPRTRCQARTDPDGRGSRQPSWRSRPLRSLDSSGRAVATKLRWPHPPPARSQRSRTRWASFPQRIASPPCIRWATDRPTGMSHGESGRRMDTTRPTTSHRTSTRLSARTARLILLLVQTHFEMMGSVIDRCRRRAVEGTGID